MTHYSDGPYVLPGGIEPYRIWFEWLKLAMRDPTVSVDMGHYNQWGPIEAVSFDEWFEENWRRLFGVSVVTKLKKGDKVKSDKEFITLEFHKRGIRNKVADQIMKFLEQMVHEEIYPQAPFMLTKTYNKGLLSNIAEARRNLRLYELSLGFAGLDDRILIERLAMVYVATYKDWSLSERALKRTVAPLSRHFSGLAKFVQERQSNPDLSMKNWEIDDGNNFITGEECGKFVRRQWLMVKAQALGICRGEFPLQGKSKKIRENFNK
jgi:hypothetical protein